MVSYTIQKSGDHHNPWTGNIEWTLAWHVHHCRIRHTSKAKAQICLQRSKTLNLSFWRLSQIWKDMENVDTIWKGDKVWEKSEELWKYGDRELPRDIWAHHCGFAPGQHVVVFWPGGRKGFSLTSDLCHINVTYVHTHTYVYIYIYIYMYIYIYVCVCVYVPS